MQKKTVCVGLSGGVDSSVAALRLKESGYHVIGVFIKVWQPDFISCNWERERLDAMRVAALLDIPFVTFDAEEVYKREVVDYMVSEYRKGRTPNPDVMCNTHVKFGAFLDFARRNGAEKIATGHYAQIRIVEGEPRLFRGRDVTKDQSYFLWGLEAAQLCHALFPVGDSRKFDVRIEAARAGIPVSKKKDSQGVCFLGEVDMAEFLSHFFKEQSGAVLDINGDAIGTHGGAARYAIGQRHGFSVETNGTKSRPQYVISKDLPQNTITVSPHPPVASQGEKISVINVNRIRTSDIEILAQFRYRQKPFRVRILENAGPGVIIEILDTGVERPSSGQSCALYDGDECVGGGIIA